MAGTNINFENSGEGFEIKLSEKEASYLHDILEKFEHFVNKGKLKKVFDYDDSDVDFVYDKLFDKIKKQIREQADKALTEEGLDLLDGKEALQALKNALDDLLRVSKGL